LLIVHILSALFVGIIFGIISRIKNKKIDIKLNPNSNFTASNQTKICTFSNLGEILSEAIINSSKTIIMIGGFVVIFSVVISILNSSKILYIISYMIYPILKFFNIKYEFAKGIISGLVELTNGVSIISSISNKSLSVNIIICAFLLGFGGLSVILQVLSIISKHKLSIKKYLLGKVMQAIISALLAYIFIKFFPFFHFDF
jgi:nucleoside recognition membrane protein YjiH